MKPTGGRWDDREGGKEGILPHALQHNREGRDVVQSDVIERAAEAQPATRDLRDRCGPVAHSRADGTQGYSQG